MYIHILYAYIYIYIEGVYTGMVMIRKLKAFYSHAIEPLETV